MTRARFPLMSNIDHACAMTLSGEDLGLGFADHYRSLSPHLEPVADAVASFMRRKHS